MTIDSHYVFWNISNSTGEYIGILQENTWLWILNMYRKINSYYLTDIWRYTYNLLVQKLRFSSPAARRIIASVLGDYERVSPDISEIIYTYPTTSRRFHGYSAENSWGEYDVFSAVQNLTKIKSMVVYFWIVNIKSLDTYQYTTDYWRYIQILLDEIS